jgi:hypothetical protein
VTFVSIHLAVLNGSRGGRRIRLDDERQADRMRRPLIVTVCCSERGRRRSNAPAAAMSQSARALSRPPTITAGAMTAASAGDRFTDKAAVPGDW